MIYILLGFFECAIRNRRHVGVCECICALEDRFCLFENKDMLFI